MSKDQRYTPGRPIRYSSELLDGVPDHRAEIPGMDKEERDALLLTTRSGHQRGRTQDGRLTIDGVPVEREPLAQAELLEDKVAADNAATIAKWERQTEHDARVDRALHESLAVAGYTDTEMAGVAKPGERDVEASPTDDRIKSDKKPNWARHHFDNSRKTAREIVAADRDPSVESPRSR